MQQKLNLIQFQQYKNRLAQIVSSLEKLENDTSITREQAEEQAEELLEPYYELEKDLLQHDLSDIPFDAWEGMVITAKEGEVLDFSKTHANLDIKVFDHFDADKFNLTGCNVKNLGVIYYRGKFEKDYMQEHPEFFPGVEIPADIQYKYYIGTLEFSDIHAYPSLLKCVDESTFTPKAFLSGELMTTNSSLLVRSIGFDNAMRLYRENPDFLLRVTQSYSSYTHLLNTAFKEIDSSNSFEEIKFSLCSSFVEENIKYGGYFDLEVFPKEMVQRFPEYLIQDDELMDEKAIKKYYCGQMTIKELRTYEDILKTKHIDRAIEETGFGK